MLVDYLLALGGFFYRLYAVTQAGCKLKVKLVSRLHHLLGELFNAVRRAAPDIIYRVIDNGAVFLL